MENERYDNEPEYMPGDDYYAVESRRRNIALPMVVGAVGMGVVLSGLFVFGNTVKSGAENLANATKKPVPGTTATAPVTVSTPNTIPSALPSTSATEAPLPTVTVTVSAPPTEAPKVTPTPSVTTLPYRPEVTAPNTTNANCKLSQVGSKALNMTLVNCEKLTTPNGSPYMLLGVKNNQQYVFQVIPNSVKSGNVILNTGRCAIGPMDKLQVATMLPQQSGSYADLTTNSLQIVHEFDTSKLTDGKMNVNQAPSLTEYLNGNVQVLDGFTCR